MSKFRNKRSDDETKIMQLLLSGRELFFFNKLNLRLTNITTLAKVTHLKNYSSFYLVLWHIGLFPSVPRLVVEAYAISIKYIQVINRHLELSTMKRNEKLHKPTSASAILSSTGSQTFQRYFVKEANASYSWSSTQFLISFYRLNIFRLLVAFLPIFSNIQR